LTPVSALRVFLSALADTLNSTRGMVVGGLSAAMISPPQN